MLLLVETTEVCLYVIGERTTRPLTLDLKPRHPQNKEHPTEEAQGFYQKLL